MKKDAITFSDFAKLDLRVGEVKEASLLEGSKKLIVLKVDLGDDYGTVEILSGLSPIYQPADLIGNKYIVLSNLEPKKIMGRDSPDFFLLVLQNRHLSLFGKNFSC